MRGRRGNAGFMVEAPCFVFPLRHFVLAHPISSSYEGLDGSFYFMQLVYTCLYLADLVFYEV